MPNATCKYAPKECIDSKYVSALDALIEGRSQHAQGADFKRGAAEKINLTPLFKKSVHTSAPRKSKYVPRWFHIIYVHY